jgi:hypothetical protein
MERNRERLFAMIDRVHDQNKDVPAEVIEGEVAEAITQVRNQAVRRTRR